ncbi:MAG: hypothetical protein Phog2KO_24950 [Phototrophicaceae bacterium]
MIRKILFLGLFLLLLMPVMAQENDEDASEAITWDEQYYAPYVYMGRYPFHQLALTAEETGVRYYSLAFILANHQCEATWLGTVPIVENSYITNFLIPDLEALRAMGGDVIISFGGAGGTDLGVACEDVESLKAQYQLVIDTYDVTHLDFDIEGDDIRDIDSLHRRFEAIAELQADNLAQGRELVISLTLPVIPTGLTEEGITVVEMAYEYGVDIAVVNIMTMNFGDSFPSDRMGDNTIQSAESLYSQLEDIYPDSDERDLWSEIGLTPMVGINDRQTEIFTLDDAQQVTDFVNETGIRLLSIWSLDRDIQCDYVNVLANDCSGVDQDPFAFSEIFNTVTE